MAEKITLEVVTPERRLLSESVDAVTVPGATGEVGVLPGHTPLISLLKTGVLSYSQGGTTKKLMVSGGFVEVADDRVSVLADLAETSGAITLEKAKQERDQAEKALQQAGTDPAALATAQLVFDRAATRFQLASEG
jgi:F-type H+-transporting ATPase subunit epsilon